MKTKKILAGAVTLLAAVTLAACSSNGKDIITMKGGSITTSEFYDRVKTNSSAQQVLLELVISDVFEQQYGKKVTDKEVDEYYNKIAKQYGNSFSAALTSAGLTIDTYKKQIRANMLVDYAVKEAAKKELTDANYKAAYDAYTPEVSAQIIKFSDEAKAKEVLAKAQAGEDFAQLAKDNSEDTATKEKGGEVKFDSTSTSVAKEVKTATFALEEGQVGASVVKVTDASTYKTSYYVVKLNKKTAKSENWKDYKKVLKESILTSKQNDYTFKTSIISKALKEANVKVKDSAFSNVLSSYITTDKTSKSSTSSSSSSK